VHVYECVRQNLEQTKLRYVEGKDASITGRTSKRIQVDFLILAKVRTR